MLVRSHRNPSSWWLRGVPTGPVEVNPDHPLAGSLVGCYVPGSYAGLNDLTGIGPTLQADAGGFVSSSPEGNGYNSSAVSSAAYATTFPAAWKIAKSGTLFWRGQFIGLPYSGSFSRLVLWGNIQNPSPSSSTPYCCYGIAFDPNTAKIMFSYSKGSTDVELLSTIASYNMLVSPLSVAVTFNVGGAISFFVWSNGPGTSIIRTVTTGTWSGSTAPDYTAFPQPCLGSDPSKDSTDISSSITTSAYLFNTALTAQQITWLDAEPFGFLRPVASLRRNSLPTGGNPFRRWNRTYLIR